MVQGTSSLRPIAQALSGQQTLLMKMRILSFGKYYGVGGMERLVVAPVHLWAVLLGAAILRGGGFLSPGAVPKDPTPG